MQHIQNKQRGFGLVEVLASIAIFTLVMVGINQLGRTALYNYETSKNRTVAYNVIQQVFEEMRNKRDANVVSAGAAWNSGLGNNGTEVNAIVSRIKPTIGLTNGNIAVEVTSVGASPTEQASNAAAAQAVEVKVTWSERRGPQSLTARTYLTDWKAKY